MAASELRNDSPESLAPSEAVLARFGNEMETPHQRYETLRSLLGESICRQLGVYPLPEDFLLSVVIPAYNEEETISELIARVRAVPLPKEIVVVDDCSRDDTLEVLKGLEGDDLRVFSHPVNQGKGAALKTGFGHVRGTMVVIQDADLEYDPAEYPRLIQPIIEGKADVVFGSRFAGDSHRVLYYWHSVGNRLLTTLSNMFTNLNLTDMETCYKVFRREVIDEIAPTLSQKRFGIEPEMTSKVARRRLRVYEQPISYSGRTYDEGKKITWRDGLSALWCIVRYSAAD